MALINCPECGKEISDKAKTCPNCGVEIAKEIKVRARVDTNGNEQTIYECKTHWIAMVAPVIIGLLFLVMGIIGLTGTKNQQVAFSFLVIGIICIGYPSLRIKTNKLVLTNKRIYGKTGIVKSQSLSSPVSKIQTVNIETSLLGKIFGYSTLTIHCITGVYIFKSQTNAKEMQGAILNTIK